MKVTLAAVISIDGKLTRGEDSKIHSWTSSEDLVHHRKLIAEHKVIVMGRNTYEAWGLKPRPGKLFVVLTHSPGQYSELTVNGQLEFTNESATALINRLEKAGHKQLLVDGGGHVNSEFMAKGLVDELLITIEPIAFGNGVNLFSGQDLDTKLKLVSTSKLNDSGSLLLHYQCLKEKA